MAYRPQFGDVVTLADGTRGVVVGIKYGDGMIPAPIKTIAVKPFGADTIVAGVDPATVTAG